MLAIREEITDRGAEVIGLAERILRDRRLTIASNRGPVEYDFDSAGRLHSHRGSGGVVTALAALSRYVPVGWVSSAMSEGDRAVAGGDLAMPTADPGLYTRFVVSPKEAYDLYYNTLSNPILWFVQHRLQHLLVPRDMDEVAVGAWRDGYLPVNRAFASALAAELRSGGASSVVMLHDYHLYLVARFLRAQVPQALLQQFIHIPWPEPEAWWALPQQIVTGICRGLLGNNIVGFQTRASVDNFLQTCDLVLPEAHVDFARATVVLNGQLTAVRNYPISIDVECLRETAASESVRRHRQRLAHICGERTIVRVDRLDPSKNVLSGFVAYAHLLARRPDLRGKVKFLAFLVPSRTGIPEYQQYARQVFGAIDMINASFGGETWQPIEVFYENDFEQSVAAMGMCDVVMVNSSLDGMNLVSKEAAILNRGDTVLVLSRGAGSYEELGGAALSVDPHDIADTAGALERALAMPLGERRLRAGALRRVVEESDITRWLHTQLDDISLLVGRLGVGSAVAAG